MNEWMEWMNKRLNKQPHELEKMNKVYMEIFASSLQISVAELGKSKPSTLGPFWWTSTDLKSHTDGQGVFQVYCEAVIFTKHSMATQDFLLKYARKDPQSKIASTHF